MITYLEEFYIEGRAWIEQELTSEFIMKENTNIKFLGKTNKGNLVFESDKKQLKVTSKGELL